jgi:hypothetical protein
MRKMPDVFIFLIGCVLPMFVLLFILLPIFFRSAMTKPSDRQPDFKRGQLALFVAAAIVLLDYVWTHVR